MHLYSTNSMKGPFGICSFYQYPDLVGLAQTSEFWGDMEVRGLVVGACGVV